MSITAVSLHPNPKRNLVFHINLNLFSNYNHSINSIPINRSQKGNLGEGKNLKWFWPKESQYLDQQVYISTKWKQNHRKRKQDFGKMESKKVVAGCGSTRIHCQLNPCSCPKKNHIRRVTISWSTCGYL